ncbi:DUF6057 family protein [Parabacteroides sp. PF5-6]|uniref:DUF6057 family protein n=1 Tax=Parabacteroides sp. PF5-6 TaxID=1742403 RepID=UPI002406A3BD|nr:DUF6057 family protein [Parabacteroides sp. PF5-6]MDF9831706.1 hypothetical protein [Parabacteroides sp. PF5-6]
MKLNLGIVIFWIAVFVGLFLFFQWKYSYYFYYIEQLQLFLYTPQFARETILQPGGLALYISLFCVQLYIYPGVGALITAFLLTGIGVLLQANLRRLAPVSLTCLLSILPVVALLTVHVDMNYKVQGTIGLLFMLGGLLVFTGIKDVIRRLVAGVVLVPVLFLLAGPVAFLFALVALLGEGLTAPRKSYWFVILPLEMLLIAYLSMRMGWQGEYRMLLFPDFYFEHLLHEKKLYYAWWAMAGSLVLARLIKNMKEPKKQTAILSYGLQLLPFCVVLYVMAERDTRVILDNMEQDYYVRHEQWDQVIQTFPREKYNNHTINLLNLALAKKGELGNRLFEYDQRGSQTLISDWDSTFPHAIALCEVYYQIGDIGAAQKLAFEGCLSSQYTGNVRLMQRLVETNLIYGAYGVAEKYINILEHTLAYKDWAKEHRRYLYDEEALAQNKTLLAKRKSLVKDGIYVKSGNTPVVFEQLAVNNPANPLPMQYLVSMYLARKDLKNFQRLLETYAKTEVWPTMAISQQEAVIVLNQKNPFFWIQNGVTTKVEKRFRAFDDLMNQSRIRPDFATKMQADHGASFWHYLVFKKV